MYPKLTLRGSNTYQLLLRQLGLLRVSSDFAAQHAGGADASDAAGGSPPPGCRYRRTTGTERTQLVSSQLLS